MNSLAGITPKEPGDLLLEAGKITEQQLEQVRRRQRRLNLPQHRALVDLNLASEEDAWRALAQANGLDFVDPLALDLKRETLELVPIKLIFHYRLLPLGIEEDCLVLAFSEPPRQMEQGNLRLLLAKRFRIVLATPSAIHAVIKKHYGLGAETIQKLREERGSEISQEIVFDVQGKETDSAVEATVSAFVDQILQEALRLHATDIHLEPYTNSIRLRYRVDGILETVPVPADMRHLHAAVVSRLKIMAGLNIAEKRLPHDGRIAMKTGDEEYDLRVSIVPTKYGEAACLRILGRQSLYLDLGQLGMEPSQEAIFAQLTELPQGLVLLTGPTGSGKTTTLYTALAQANDEGRKVITFEDPIEYQLEGTVQIQVREQIGLTFASGLRSVLRHDPDVVLVGEIRDFETAEIAVRAAQTGHLVLSTLHTNDSISAVTRLLEMKIEAYLIASSLVCSISQRLARRICRHCSEEDRNIPEPIR
ncbi:MAG TPA: GspE/PulE family protein, partial [Patescibacteria group bacterium]|nr:GspE/PulE family protein [Patescibacteria group bacterium]